MKAKGFTLIEILIVVLILTILSYFGVIQYRKLVLKAQYSRMQSYLDPVYKVVEENYLQTGKGVNDFNAIADRLPKNCHTQDNGYAVCIPPGAIAIHIFPLHYEEGESPACTFASTSITPTVSAFYGRCHTYTQPYNYLDQGWHKGISLCLTNYSGGTAEYEMQRELCKIVGGREIYPGTFEL